MEAEVTVEKNTSEIVSSINNNPQHSKVNLNNASSQPRGRILLDSDSETESEGSIEWSAPAPKSTISHKQSEHALPENTETGKKPSQSHNTPNDFTPVLEQPPSINRSAGLAREVRHKKADKRVGVHGQHEHTSLLVEVPIHDTSDVEDEIPLSWQSSSRAMREQLIKDGYNLDLESDNEDLDLIPPKQTYSEGGICSCSGDACSIS